MWLSLRQRFTRPLPSGYCLTSPTSRREAPKQQLAKKSIPENPFKPVSPEALNNLNKDKQVADNDPDKQTPPESTEPQSVALLVDSKDAVWEGSRPGRKLPKGYQNVTKVELAE